MITQLMPRQKWVDISKAFGIFLVFYGHLLEVIVNEYSVAFEQYKFIYSFHMPLFFFMSGFFGKQSINTFQRIKSLTIHRLIPVLFFSLLCVPGFIFLLLKGVLSGKQFVGLLFQYFYGFPAFNIVTWFLVCLFTSEVLSLGFFKLVEKKYQLVGSIIVLSAGLFLCNYFYSTKVPNNFWYINEAIVALGFYLLGYIAFPYLSKINESKIKYPLAFILTGISFTILILSFNLNSPSIKGFHVAMISSIHGEIVPFIITAFAGITFMISLSMLLPSKRELEYFGQNTLILLGLNGIFLTFINNKIFSIFPVHSNSWLSITIHCCILTIISLLICVPIIKILKKWVPQLVGNPIKVGPLLPQLDSNPFTKDK